MITGTSLADSEQALQLCGELDEGGRLFTTAGVHPTRPATGTPTPLAACAPCSTTSGYARWANAVSTSIATSLPVRPRKRPWRNNWHWPSSYSVRCSSTNATPASACWRSCATSDRLPAAVVHCFTGERRALYGYLDLDLHIGITGWINDERRGTTCMIW